VPVLCSVDKFNIIYNIIIYNIMYKFEDIRQLHLEITQKCQASCSMCDRNINGGEVNPYLNMDELSINDVKHMFNIKFINQLKSLQLCGNHGDPIIASDTLEIIEYFRKNNPTLWITMNTNAGARDETWWKNLATIIGKNGTVIFSIDGLEDTNHLYRQNVQWEKIQRAFENFIQAGGRARWDFLVFDYNEHQINEAKKLSTQWGFEKFIVKKSSRFISGTTSIKKTEHTAINRKGEKTIIIKEPSNDSLKNQVLENQAELLKKYMSMDNFYDKSEISCRVKETGSLYVSAEGIVLPCCWTAGRMYKWWMKPQQDQIWKFINKVGGKNALNAKQIPIEEIFKTGIFEDIEKSWNIEGVKNGRLKVCAMKCSKEFDVVQSQYK